jgi:hypothetical protein
MPGIFNASRIATGLPGSDLPEIQTGNEIPNLRDGRMSWNGLLLLIRVFFFCLWKLNELNSESLGFFVAAPDLSRPLRPLPFLLRYLRDVPAP